MKKLDIRSILIGVLCTALVFVLIGAKSQNENLGDIRVTSVTVMNEDGSMAILNGSSLTMGLKGYPMVSIICEDLGGALSTHNADGEKTSYLGTGEAGGGFISTYNKHEVMVGYFGSNKDGDGVAVLSDRYGDSGWRESGKQ